jgi:ABC-2 type transport system permease protein
VLAGLTAVLVISSPMQMEHMGVPLFPTTEHLSGFLAAPLANPQDIFWMIVPLLVVFYAGELVWRERDGGLGEIADAAPVPEWVPLAGKFLGLALVLVAHNAVMIAMGMLIQAYLGYYDFEPGLYVRILLGLQLADYLLFALLALVVHVVVDQKYLGHAVALMAYVFIAFAPSLGLEHALLVYGSDPGWSYSDMRGFGASLGPWTWYKAYWAAWALLLAVAARLLWARGTERALAKRLQVARRRFSRPVAGAAALATALILSLGGFVFYNTYVLADHGTVAESAERRAEYERRYGRYEGIPQPRLAGTRLHVELIPARRTVEVRGTQLLINRSAVAIGSIHVSTRREVETQGVRFDRPAVRVLADTEFGHAVYRLATPLQPGDSLRLSFEVRYAPRGFSRGELEGLVVENGTMFAEKWLPAIGYRADRRLANAGERRMHGLPPRPEIPPLEDEAARHDVIGVEPIAFDAVVGTDAGQVAVAPGRLRRTWTERGRRYFHYVSDAPIRNEYAFYSAAYAVHEARWTPPGGAGRPVLIQIYHHPGHAWNMERMVRSIQLSLDHFTAQLGPYPHGQVRLVERPGSGNSLHASPVNMWYQEGFALFRPERDPRELNFPFAVVAHEVAHQWWGNQLTPAGVEGGGVLSESLAWYSAMGVVEKTYGEAHLRRLLGMMRELYRTPRTRAVLPLLRAGDRFLLYRKGPFALYTVREYAGQAAMDTALRRLLQKHGSAAPPLPTTLDLYRELQGVTPDSLRPLLADLFERNTFWELEAERARAEPAADGTWRVTLDVRARKVVVDTAAVETERPMDDVVEVGVYAAGEDGEPGAQLYRRMHRVRSGEQRITVTVRGEPARAGIDPRNLLVEGEEDGNVVRVTRGAPRPAGAGRGSAAVTEAADRREAAGRAEITCS